MEGSPRGPAPEARLRQVRRSRLGGLRSRPPLLHERGRGRAHAPEKLAPRLLEADSKVLEQAAAASTAVGDLRPPRNRFASIALDQFTGNLPPPTEMCVAALSLHLTSKASKGVEPLAAQRVSDRMHVPPSAADPTPAARAIIPPAMAPRVGLGADLLALYARDR